MATGIVLFANPNADNIVDDFVAQARQAHDLGVRQVWLPQRFDYDAIGLAGVIGAAVPGLGVGTFVVPFNPRHPLIVASQAETTQAAAHGRFILGLGLGAHEVEHRAFGTAWPHTIARLREHLTVLRSIFDSGVAGFHGAEFTANPEWPVQVPGGTPVPLYVAAMGPKALQVTGELADGTLPYLAGPRTIAEFIVPTVAQAAAEAGRPAPKIVAAVPVLVSDDVDAGRRRAAEHLSFYEQIPSYRRVLEREGVDSAVEVAAVGPAETVTRQLKNYLEAGATDVVLSAVDGVDPAQREAIWTIAAQL
ncbi:LLM class F420-dependent oxidoreductase [Mycobacterium sp. E136]|uniref:LLM class F420-dependent oxidoreductase n=1 Tax=Mycobacterium sp. E136 TaxID=1834125 RepID=UPI0007FBF002|nr:LLM class F420-dependent oxidoreductase [Mycobacterium sp. E136]OBG91230.1 LLM class F420-dependent oxidoreductase [Mycobacterium sp. E136]